MCQTNLTRRQLLRQAALLAATVPALAAISPHRSFASALEGLRGPVGVGPAVPLHLELVTVTDTQAVITWMTGDPTDLDEFRRPRPVSAPGRVLIGADPDPRTWREVGVHAATPFHYVVVDGLEPGKTYYWRAESAGVVAVPTVMSRTNPLDLVAPPKFTTLVPPSGRELGRVAWFNDLHFGEQIAGLAYSNGQLPGGGLPPGFPVDPDHPYWRFMSRNAVDEARALGCTLLLANGDLTSEAEPDELAECRDTLDVFGTIGGANTTTPGRADLRPGDDPAYFVTRGNHDRAHQGDTYASCSSHDEDLRDCFSDVFTPSWEPGSTHFSVTIGDDRARYRFVGLDSNDGAATGVLRPGELDYLEQELARGDLTIPLFHHPASDLAGLSDPIPGGSTLATPDAEAFRAMVAANSNVGGVYAGHTHRNNRSLATGTGDVPFFEGGAVKEYPGGFTQVRLFEDGYMVNFFKTSAPDARAWSEVTRGEYLGFAPHYQLGGFGDRNWVHHVDARRTVFAS